ncbi:MAG: hypothetical protein J0H71_12725 [Rhizobiales bacterium]|nr:hypothetical protein [Hyphomicrobiales bacterium]
MIVGAAIARSLLAVPAHAETFSSAYTSTAEKDCRADATICKGIDGLIVLVQEDDLRRTVSIGRTARQAEKEPATSQSFGPFNYTADTIEWRRDGAGKPFATIQRWYLADNDDTDKNGRPRSAQMLVVTRLPPGAVCHVAYVDVKANPNANEVARDAADRLAKTFDCAKDKVSAVGNSGRATALGLAR